MRICRFDENRLGVIDGNSVLDVSEALAVIPGATYPFPRHDALIANLAEVLAAIGRISAPVARPLAEVTLLSPVANPGKLVAAPVNYEAHLSEARADPATFAAVHVRRIEETGLFLKGTSSLIGAGAAVEIHHSERRTDHEIELAVIIGKTCRKVSRDRALDHVAGYAIGLDITIRGPEERSLRKTLDTYSVLGPCFVTADEFGDPAGHELVLKIGDEVRQRANTSDLILDVPALIAFASSFYTLHPGDVIYSGTPEGVGPIIPGDTIDAAISGIGRMQVAVVAG